MMLLYYLGTCLEYFIRIVLKIIFLSNKVTTKVVFVYAGGGH